MAHAGSAADRSLAGLELVSASAIPNMRGITKGNKSFETVGKLGAETDGALAHELSREEIALLVEKWATATRRAKEAGADGCEIHSAHGYLLNQFYSPLTNNREDEYTGKTLDGRIHIHLQIIKAVREAVGKDFVISMRLGACDYGNGGTTIEDSVVAAKRFEEAGLDMLSVSGGMCDYVNPISDEPGWFQDVSGAIKQSVHIPVLLTGGIADGIAAEQLLESGKADLIGVGRALLRDSSWPQKNLR